jgi:hypothetical protein
MATDVFSIRRDYHGKAVLTDGIDSCLTLDMMGRREESRMERSLIGKK